MTVSTPSSTDSRVQFCSLVSAASGEDPIGSAWSLPRFIIIELPLPWAYETMGSRNVPAGLKEVIYDLYAQDVPWGFLAMAPNPAYSVEGMTRILEYDLVGDQLTGFSVREFLVPTSDVTHFFALYGRNQDAPEIDTYRQSRDDSTRDLFVCTHGAIDVCCAKFGYPVYKELSRLVDADVAASGVLTRVWRCTHFGGHRFAPTVLEMPGGRYWGRLQSNTLRGLIHHDEPASEMRPCYRGWAALPHVLQQVAEGEAFLRGGWEWTRCTVTISAAPEAEDAIEGTFTLGYLHPAGERGEITINVIPDGTIETMGSSSAPDVLTDAQQFRCEVVSVSPAGGLLDRPAGISPHS